MLRCQLLFRRDSPSRPHSDVHFVSTLEPLSNAVKRNAPRGTITPAPWGPAPSRTSAASSSSAQSTSSKLPKEVSSLQTRSGPVSERSLNVTSVLSPLNAILLVVKGQYYYIMCSLDTLRDLCPKSLGEVLSAVSLKLNPKSYFLRNSYVVNEFFLI